mgnify:CR=1 FL=1
MRIGFPYELNSEKKILWVFTTRADTLFGATFMAVAAEHPIATFAAQKNAALKDFVEECKRGAVMEAELAQIEKKGMATGLSVSHPLTGEKIPVWVGNYVLMSYGEGAVMGVPAHDERDLEFARKYGLPIKQVIQPSAGDRHAGAAYADWVHQLGKVRRSGLPAGCRRNRRRFGEKGIWEKSRSSGGCATGASRASATGARRSRSCTAPPAATCRCRTSSCRCCCPRTWCPTAPATRSTSCAAYVDTKCPSCGKPAKRETDTMDTFVDSSWYFARFACPGQDKAMLDARANYWMPVDQYIGGIEHAILHLLYSRFFQRVMRDETG